MGMKKVNIHYAKTHLSKLIEEMEQGEDVVIARSGKPVARLIMFEDIPKRKPGALAGKIMISDDFDEIPPSLLDAFNGRGD